MKFPISKFIGAAALALMMMLSMASDSLAQGRGRGHRGFSHFDKKCAKFVNCHDASEGRWDGRGPRRNRRHTRYRLWRYRR